MLRQRVPIGDAPVERFRRNAASRNSRIKVIAQSFDGLLSARTCIRNKVAILVDNAACKTATSS